jgi:hypothetical protein
MKEEEDMASRLRQRGIQFVDFDGWKSIQEVEKKRGEKKKKVMEKITNVEEMLEISAK